MPDMSVECRACGKFFIVHDIYKAVEHIIKYGDINNIASSYLVKIANNGK